MSDHKYKKGDMVWFSWRVNGDTEPAIITDGADYRGGYGVAIKPNMSVGGVSTSRLSLRHEPAEYDKEILNTLTPPPKDPRTWKVHIPFVYRETGALSTRTAVSSYQLVSTNGIESVHTFAQPVSEHAARQIADLDLKARIIEYEDVNRDR
jgi:hypothetical protein